MPGYALGVGGAALVGVIAAWLLASVAPNRGDLVAHVPSGLGAVHVPGDGGVGQVLTLVDGGGALPDPTWQAPPAGSPPPVPLTFDLPLASGATTAQVLPVVLPATRALTTLQVAWTVPTVDAGACLSAAWSATLTAGDGTHGAVSGTAAAYTTGAETAVTYTWTHASPPVPLWLALSYAAPAGCTGSWVGTVTLE